MIKNRTALRRTQKTLDVIITYCVLLIVSFLFFFPCLWLILASFSKSGSIYSFDGFFPKEYGIDSFVLLFSDTVMYNYRRWFLNTLFIATCSCVLGTFLTILTAYCMSRFRFRSRKAMMKATLVLGMFPSFMGTIAVYLIMTQFHLVNQPWGLILIYSAQAPMGYMVQKGFFDTIPYSIDEAARIDGATNYEIFAKFILPKMLLQDKDLYTVAVGLMSLGETEFARFAAGSIVIAIPIVVLYFCLVKYMINGMSAGAVKE